MEENRDLVLANFIATVENLRVNYEILEQNKENGRKQDQIIKLLEEVRDGRTI